MPTVLTAALPALMPTLTTVPATDTAELATEAVVDTTLQPQSSAAAAASADNADR